MPHVRALTRHKFSDVGPLPQVLNVGERFAVMLLCLKGRQELRAPDKDAAETIFTIPSGGGFVREGDTLHEVEPGM